MVGVNDVHFTIHTKHTDLWTGIAFSHNERMSQTDAVLGWVDRAGRSFVMDTWLGSYQAPLLDAAQDVRNVSGRLLDGMTELSFVRPINSRDSKVRNIYFQYICDFVIYNCLFIFFIF